MCKPGEVVYFGKDLQNKKCAHTQISAFLHSSRVSLSCLCSFLEATEVLNLMIWMLNMKKIRSISLFGWFTFCPIAMTARTVWPSLLCTTHTGCWFLRSNKSQTKEGLMITYNDKGQFVTHERLQFDVKILASLTFLLGNVLQFQG